MGRIGVIIFTADDADFRQGNHIVMYGQLSTPPTAPDTTYILHANWTAKQALEWVDHVPYRFVIVTKKAPRTKDERIIIHKSLSKKADDTNRRINALFKYSDRDWVFHQIKEVPVPLLLSWVRRNRPYDIQVWEDIADVKFMLHDDYLYSLLAYGIRPSADSVEWPRKAYKEGDVLDGFRYSDVYRDEINEIGSDDVWL